MSSNYMRNTLGSFLKKLRDGKYHREGPAKCAVTRSVELSYKEKKVAFRAIKKHFSEEAEPATSKKKTGNGNGIKKATLESFSKEVPFEVQFARVVINGTREKTLSLLRGAADRGYTLPLLIASIEAV